jgi:hypothetical protein
MASKIDFCLDMTVPRTLVFLLCLLLVAVDRSNAQAAVRQDSTLTAQNDWSGTWAASTSSGRTLMGTWTAVIDTTTGTVTGTWTLVDAQGTTRADGGWSASKAPTQWNGNWRAVISGRDGEYSGTWSADIQLKGNAQFADLFAKAVQSAVSGSWRARSQSGAWSIRTAK